MAQTISDALTNLGMGLFPEDYVVVAGELIKSYDHPFHAWE